jgi:putative membrane protein
MKKIIALILIPFFAFTLAQDKQNEKRADRENEFVKEAAHGSMMEIELGKLASEKATSEKVKEFGQLMVKDHTKASEELKQIAKNNNIEIPESMSEDHRESINEFNQLSNDEFDREFMSKMIEAHEKDIEKFEEAAQENENEQIRQWAEKTLPTLKEHQRIAQNTMNSLEQLSRKDQTRDNQTRDDQTRDREE